MNLLNRYLQEVSKYLPKARREDIVAELRANILSQIEDREQELGRALTDTELVEMLQHHGNPLMVAGRYGPHNLGLAFGIQLIGPELFPYYRTVLGVIWGISLTVMAVAMPIIARTVGEKVALGRVLLPLAVQFAVTTVIFVLLDRGKGHLLNRWDPGKLPALKTDSEDGPNARRIFNFIATAVGALWLALAPRSPYLLLGPAAISLEAVPMKLMPEWMQFYWAIVALLCFQLGLQFLNLLRLLPRRGAQVADLILKCAGLVIGILLLFKFPNYVTSPYPDVAEWANLSFLICVIVAVAIGLFAVVRLLLRERRAVLPGPRVAHGKS
jgi:hypothetical protein